MKIIDKIKKEVNLEGFHLVCDMYKKHGKQVAHFSNNVVDKYIITDGEKILDVQVD